MRGLRNMNTMPRGGKRKGAGRKPVHGEPMEKVSARVPVPMATEIKRRADARGVTTSQVVVDALRSAFKRK